MDNTILKYYVTICRRFLKSNIWTDKVGIKLYKKNPNCVEWQDYPILLLYKPIDKISRLDMRKISKNESKIDIKFYAAQIWYAIDCRSDVRMATSDGAINVSKELVVYITSYFGVEETTLMNRSFLSYISGKLWEELGGDK